MVNNDNNTSKRSAKGIPHSQVLEINNFRDTLYNGKIKKHRTTLKTLRLSRQRKMARYTLYKKGLSDLFYKMRMCDDKITCLPLTLNGKYL